MSKKKLTRPKSILIGPHTFTIEWSDTIDDCGTMAGHDLAIQVSSKLPASLAKETLLHEILHAILYLNGNVEEPLDEERIVQGLGAGLLAVFSENPVVVDYLTGTLSRSSGPA